MVLDRCNFFSSLSSKTIIFLSQGRSFFTTEFLLYFTSYDQYFQKSMITTAYVEDQLLINYVTLAIAPLLKIKDLKTIKSAT
mmetsp:Transcript_23482/g.33703  ORF Transcript_23482/g.33703 Transcript_23482/m.33703 type:complete len:82 (-) Transcript_23482:805-1050(-)